MKGLKLSKTSILALASGVFLVGLLSLGITRFNQVSEQDDLNEEVSVSKMMLGSMDLTSQQLQLTELQEQYAEISSQIEDAKSRLVQSVISVDVTDKIYTIAEYYDVIINNITTTKNQTEVYAGIGCLSININAAISGEMTNVIDFIAGLNDNFDTGFVRSTHLTISDNTTESGTSANVMMVVYTLTGG